MFGRCELKMEQVSLCNCNSLRDLTLFCIRTIMIRERILADPKIPEVGIYKQYNVVLGQQRREKEHWLEQSEKFPVLLTH